MMDAFKLQDNFNGYAIVGGVTNINLPFDTNPANGAISASLYLPPAMPLEYMVGSYVFEVASPTGQLATAIFAITNTPLPQSVMGTVYQSDGETPFPNAVVAAQDLIHGNVGNSVVADGSGHYLLSLYPGEYGLIGVAPNHYYDSGTAVAFNLTNGLIVTNNLVLSNGGPYTISGNVNDTATGQGISGMAARRRVVPTAEAGRRMSET